MISIEQVTKTFGDVRALDQVDAQIGENSIFGLTGTYEAGYPQGTVRDSRSDQGGGTAAGT